MHRTQIGRHGISAESLARVVDQSVDCVKLIGLDGTIGYMNPNGLCAMEISDPNTVIGKDWSSVWPPESRAAITQSYVAARAGEVARFRAVCPTANGAPRWWDVTVSAVSNSEGVVSGYLAVSRDVTENQLAHQALDIAAQELRHRLKNTYTMIASLIRGYARGDQLKSEFADLMSQRLIALARAQTLFADSADDCRLDELVLSLIQPFDSPTFQLTFADLPSIRIRPDMANAIAIIVGELAVNSSKHGAIRYGGTISVDSPADGTGIRLRWKENSIMPVAANSREGGQGLTLISRIAAARGGHIRA